MLAAVLAAAALTQPALAAGAAATIRVELDAREAPRKILHSRLTFPVSPGTMSLTYPKWIPGDHRASGPLRDVVGLKITAAGRAIAWRRDDVDLYTIRFDAPSGAGEVQVAFDFVYPEDDGEGAEPVSITDVLAVLCWHVAVMYPTGAASDALIYQASLRLPAGWKYATALQGRTTGDEIRFEPVSLTTLIDSPVLAGRHMRSVPLTSDPARPVSLELAADSPEALAIPDTEIARYRRVVEQADALFGARPFRRYQFLVALSDVFEGEATEHHESSDNRVQERTYLDGTLRLMNAALLTHEYAHAWNGKYRRPAGIATPNYSEPMRDDLLWVYEGLTEYLGLVLAARSGLYSAGECRDELATTGAFHDRAAGRTWRPLLDTAIEAPVLYPAPRAWRAWRRGADYYDESVFIWMEADVTIRRLTKNARSLDDFCRAFHGGRDGSPAVLPYTQADVIAALNAVATFDWAGFFTERLERVNPRLPVGGLEGAGWRIAFTDTATDAVTGAESAYEYLNLYYSLGLRLRRSGEVADVMPGTPADRAGLAPGMQLVAVSGRKWSADLLQAAIVASRTNTEPIELLVSNGEFFHTLRVDDHSGPRYPRLERVAGTSDVLTRILSPRAIRPTRRR